MAINAASLARELDKSAAEWTVASLHRTFLDHGCAVVRDVIPIARLAATRDAISAAYEKTADPHVHDPDIRSISGGKLYLGAVIGRNIAFQLDGFRAPNLINSGNGRLISTSIVRFTAFCSRLTSGFHSTNAAFMPPPFNSCR
jgi:hypothetical protein